MKLTLPEVAEILILSDGGMLDEELAERFDVHKTTITRLKQGKIKKGIEARKMIENQIEEAKSWGFSRLSETEKIFFIIPDKYKRKYFVEKLNKLLSRFKELYAIENYWRVWTDDLKKEAREVKNTLLLYKDAIIKYGIVSKSTIREYIDILTMEGNEQTDAIEDALYDLAYAVEDLYNVNKYTIFTVKEICGTDEICENTISIIKDFSRCLDEEKKYAGIKREKFTNKAHINVYEVLRNGKIVVSRKRTFLSFINERIKNIKREYVRAFNHCDHFKFEKEWYSPEKINEKYQSVVERLMQIYERIENTLDKKH